MTLEDIANRIMFTGMKENEVLEHWEYRKGKTIDDIHKAREKALKHRYGRGKTELEIDWFTLFLKDVLKKRRK